MRIYNSFYKPTHNNQRGSLPILAALLILALIGAGALAIYTYAKTRSDTTQTTPSPSSPTLPLATSTPTTLTTYTNNDLGLTFQYPSQYGTINLNQDVDSYNNGIRYTGTFVNNPRLRFIITSNTYRDEGTNLLDIFRGHYEENNKIYYKWADSQYTNASPVQINTPIKTLTINNKKIYIVNDTSFVHHDGPAIGPGAGNIAGLVNLNKPTYPGVVFMTSMPEAELEQLLITIKI